MVSQRLEMPAAIGAPSSLRNYMVNNTAHVQAREFSNAHRLPGQHAHPSVHRTNDLEGLGPYTAFLMNEDADTHTHERAVAGRGRRAHMVLQAANRWVALCRNKCPPYIGVNNWQSDETTKCREEGKMLSHYSSTCKSLQIWIALWVP